MGGSATSDITDVEVPTAINRRRLAGGLSAETHAELIRSAGDVLAEMARLELNGDVKAQAIELSQTAIIRSFDAIQVATAIVAARVSRRHGNSFVFLTADTRQAQVARTVFGERRTMLLDPL